MSTNPKEKYYVVRKWKHLKKETEKNRTWIPINLILISYFL